MSRLKIVRPVEVEVYRCDGPRCQAECDSRFPDMPSDNAWTQGTVSEGCGWLAIPRLLRTKHNYTDAQYVSREFSRDEPLYFCGYHCLADWATAKAHENTSTAA